MHRGRGKTKMTICARKAREGVPSSLINYPETVLSWYNSEREQYFSYSLMTSVNVVNRVNINSDACVCVVNNNLIMCNTKLSADEFAEPLLNSSASFH